MNQSDLDAVRHAPKPSPFNSDRGIVYTILLATLFWGAVIYAFIWWLWLR
jgi:hypothetical protein